MQIAGKSLYIHVPFCLKKCPYCHFYSIYPTEERKKSLVDSLIKEIKSYPLFSPISIYFGGGTPSLLGTDYLSQILNSLDLTKTLEITLEINPNDVSFEKILEFKKIGINRMSIGVQSFIDEDLKELGRSHDSQMAIDAIWNIYNAGIKNISIDLIYDIPNQTKKNFEKSLDFAIFLPITHLSLYNLTIEEGTVFYKNKNQILAKIDNKNSVHFLNMALKKLKSGSFKRYEISAFSRDKISIHNIGYWTAREFIGVGPSAFSHYEGKRYKNVSNLDLYVEKIQSNQSPCDFQEKLSSIRARKEQIAIQLRVIDGIDLEKFKKQFGWSKILDREINKLIEEGFLKKTNRLKLTKRGTLFYDLVAERII